MQTILAEAIPSILAEPLEPETIDPLIDIGDLVDDGPGVLGRERLHRLEEPSKILHNLAVRMRGHALLVV